MFHSANNCLCTITLPHGPYKSIAVDIVICIIFVIQDVQEGDMLCGEYGPHTPFIQRHCCSCDVSYEELDDPEINCRYLLSCNMDWIAQGNNKELQTRWLQHKLDNTFYHMPLAADTERGIFGATPVETMHAYRKDIIERVTFLVLDNVPASKKALLDDLAFKFPKSHRQTWLGNFHATDFTNGITYLTKISASECLSLVFFVCNLGPIP